MGLGAAAAVGAVTGLSACNKNAPDSHSNVQNDSPSQGKSESVANNGNAAAAPKTKRIVFYFTGTGNCLYVARELSDNIVSIPQAFKNNQLEYEAEEIGFVYPVYGMMPPNMVRKFIQKASLKADYFFAVATYGNRQGNAVNVWNDIAKEAGKNFDYIATLLMVDNWLPMFDMNEQKAMDKHIPENLSKIKTSIQNREKYLEPAPEGAAEGWSKRLEATSGPFRGDGIHANAEEWFTITDACISCGICTKVCPRKNYTVPGEKAVAKGECELCFACVHNCPHKAIVITSGEKNPKARYRNEAVKVKDIIQANNQG